MRVSSASPLLTCTLLCPTGLHLQNPSAKNYEEYRDGNAKPHMGLCLAWSAEPLRGRHTHKTRCLQTCSPPLFPELHVLLYRSLGTCW